jgi:glutamyl-tRNA synthetase
VEDLIRKYALKNAFDFGTARESVIIGKLINENSEAKAKMGTLAPLIKKIVSEVNKLSKAQVESEISKKWPELLEKEKVKEEKRLPPLPNAVKGRVVTRIPPEPNGYPHLGHALSFLINYLYAREYEGKVWLRFEDTNPRGEKLEFYNIIKENIKWLGITWDYEKNVSDDIPILVEKGRELVKRGKAYMCTCSAETESKMRFEGKECACRKNNIEKNMKLWDQMCEGKYNEGEICARLLGDMKSQNFVMRDPTLFRIIEATHALHGNKYRVYPTYDFANAIEDGICGITHVLRSNEFEPRIELQHALRALLGYKNPEVIQYSRFSLEGTPTSKREIKKLVEEKSVLGWNDPRLSTIEGLKRRGIVPETIRELTLQIGLSTSQPVIGWELLLGINQKILDPKADRYFFVPSPVKVTVEKAPAKTVKLRLHPSEERGFREFPTKGTFYLPGNETLEGEIRLKDLYNIKFTGKGKAVYSGDEMKKEIPKFQWVTEDHAEFSLIVPGVLIINDAFNPKSLVTIKGYGEKALASVPVGTIVQLERVGFARVDSPGVLVLADMPKNLIH